MADLAPPPDLVSPPDDLQPQPFARTIRDVGERSGATAASPKGALGQMQVMPSTAASPGLGVQPIQTPTLEEFNRVGNDYSAALLKRYGGNRMLAAAAYNAGPGQVDQWIQKIGDPRQGHISDVDFANQIPFPETRDYAHRILATPVSDSGPTPTDEGPPPDLMSPPPDLVTPPANHSAAPTTGKPPKLPDPGLFGSFTQGLETGIRNIGKGLNALTGDKLANAPVKQAVSDQMASAAAGIDPDAVDWTALIGQLAHFGKTPDNAPTTATQPYQFKDLVHPGDLAEKVLNTVGESTPSLAAASIAGPVGAGAVTGAQAIGPYYQQELAKTPNDPTGALTRANENAAVDGVATALTWKLFEFMPFKHEVGKVTNELTGEAAAVYQKTIGDTIKNLSLQGLGIQGGAAVVTQSIHNVMQGKSWDDGLPQAYTQGVIGNTILAGIGALVGKNRPTISKFKKQEGAFAYDPSAHGDGTIDQDGGVPPGGGQPPMDLLPPSGTTGPSPPPKGPGGAPVPDTDIGMKFPDGRTERVTVKGYSPDGKIAHLEFEDGSIGQNLTSDVLRDMVPPPANREETPAPNSDQQIGPHENVPPFEEAPPPLPGASAQARMAAREPKPSLFPEAAHALDLAGRMESAALDPTIPMSTQDRIAALQQVSRIRQQFTTEGEETLPNAYRHPLAGEPAADLGDLAAARVAKPDLYQGEAPYRHPMADEPAANLGELAAARVAKPSLYGDVSMEQDVPHANTASSPPQAHTSQMPQEQAASWNPVQPVRGDASGQAPTMPSVPRSGYEGSPPEEGGRNDQRADLTPTKMRVAGLPVAITTPRGDIRRGTGPNGEKWENRNPLAHYGYITHTGQTSADGDHIDALVGQHPNSPVAYVVDQVDPKTGTFDESKVVLAMQTEKDARAAYEAQFSDGSGPQRIGAITKMPMVPFKEWLKDGDLHAPLNPEANPDYHVALRDVRDAGSKATTDRDLLTQIQKIGGIRLTDSAGNTTLQGQTIRQILGDYRRPGLINNRTGLKPDHLRESLMQDGWFGYGDDSQTDLQPLYDLLDRAARGQKVYHPESDAQSIAERRSLINEEMGRAGVKAGDSNPDAAKKLLDFRRNGVEEMATNYENAADDDVENLSPGAHELLTEYGYEPGADIGVEHEPGAEPQESQRVEETQHAGESEREGQDDGPERAEEPEGGGPTEEEVSPPAVSDERPVEAGAEGKDQSVIPGAERSARQLAESREASGHGRIKPKSEQKEPEGLFAEPDKQKLLLQVPDEQDISRQTDTPEFKRWFGNSKVADENGEPIRVYHGTARPDRIGARFRKSRATSGPMSFFTEDPDLASGYATGKQDTSLHDQDTNYETWFKSKIEGARNPVAIDRLWYDLTPDERAKIADLAPRVSRDDETGENLELKPEGYKHGLGGYDQHLKEARGNHLKALVDEWLNSGALFNDEPEFAKILKMAGLDRPVQEDFPHATYPAVLPAYLSIRNPLDTSNIKPEVVQALDKAAARQRAKPKQYGADIWAKDSRSAKDWMEALHEGIDKPNSGHAFTSIPDWVTETLKKLGYDGIKDVGGKNGGKEHNVWVPFEESQVKSAVGNSGAFDPNDPRIHMQVEDQKPFYSALTRAIEALPQERAPGPQWGGIIANLKNKGVKDDEIQWSGIKDWLAEQKGPVTKAAILDYLRANEVQIKEVHLGKVRDDIAPDKQAQEEHAVEFERLNEAIRKTEEMRAKTRKDPRYETAYKQALEEDTKLREERETLHSRMVDETMARSGLSGEPTKYGTHVLPGGENYRELLLTLPEKAPELPDGYTVKPFQQGFAVFDTQGEEVAWSPTRGGALANATPSISRKVGASPTFRSGHWEAPNILAHIRFDDRVGQNGEKILHISEVQSDWAQKGRRSGYRGEPPKPIVVTTFAPREHDYVVNFSDGSKSNVGKGTIGANATMGDIERYYDNIVRQKTRDLVKAHENAVPDIPFKSTEAWSSLALRRMLRYAAENGYSHLSWDSGETQADRYDLSKQIKSVQWFPKEEGYLAPHENLLEAFDHDGKKVLDQKVDAKDLSDVIGKEAAQKLIDAPSTDSGRGRIKQLSGLDLKIGGEGQKGFYDKILPAVANKIGKKWGAKVEDITVLAPESTLANRYHVEQNRSGEYEIRDSHTDSVVKTFDMPGLANKEARRLNGSEAKEKTASAHSIAITPEMKASVMQGQPLFQRGASILASNNSGTVQVLGPGLIGRLAENPTEAEARLIEQVNKIAKQIVPTAKVIPTKQLMVVHKVPQEGGHMQSKGQMISGAAYIDGPRRLIAWSMGSRDPVATVRHEAIHYLRNVGFFSPREWEILAKAAEDDGWLDKHRIDKRYPDLDQGEKIEEAVAEEFGKWNRNEVTPEAGVRRLFARIRTLLDNTRRYLKSLFGKDATAEDIFSDVAGGKVGRRPAAGEPPISAEVRAQAADEPEGPPHNLQEGRDYIDQTSEDLAHHLRGAAPGTYARTLQHLAPNGPEIFLRANWLQQHVMGPRTVAEIDTKSGRFWNALKAEEDEGHRRLTDLRDRIEKTFLKQPKASQDRINAVMELDRLANRTRADDGRSIVARNVDAQYANGSKPGDTIILTPDETRGYYELQNMYRRAWDNIMEGAARRMGWVQPWSPAMADNLSLISKAVDTADHPRNRKAFQRLADVMQAMDAQRRSAYMPLMRFGDYYMSVRPKVDSESLGGFPTTTWFEMAERSALQYADVDPMKMLRGDTTKTGEVPDYAKKRLAELKQRFPADKYMVRSGYLMNTPDELRKLDIPAVEKLLMLLEGGVMDRLKTDASMDGFANKAAARESAKQKYDDLYSDLVDAVQDEMYEQLKAGFKKKSNAVPGYSGDWNRVLGSYMNWTTRHVARQIHGDTVERIYHDIQTSHPHKSIKEFWRKWKQDDDNPLSPLSRIGMAANQVGFLWTLAMNPASTMSIMMHGPNYGVPVLSTGIGMDKAASAFTRAYGEATAALGADTRHGLQITIAKVGKTPDERQFLDKLARDGDLHAKGAEDVRSMGEKASAIWGDYAPAMKRSMDIVSSNIAAADQANRVAMALAGYRLARDGDLGRMNDVWSSNQVWRATAHADGVSPDTMGKFMLTQGVGEWGGRSRSEWGRSTMGRMASALHGFQVRYLSNLLKQALRQGPEGRIALAWTLAALWAVAGLQGLPFVGDAENLADAVWKQITKHDPMVEWRLRALLVDAGLGKTGADLIMRGPLSVISGADFSSRLGFGSPITNDVLPLLSGGEQAALTFPSIVMGIYSGATKRLASHQPASAAASTLPAALKHPAQAVIDREHGIKSQTGKTTYVPARKVTAADTAAEGLGFTPLDVARAREHADYRYRARTARGSRPKDTTP